MLTGETFKARPTQPTDKERQMAHETVEQLIALHYDALDRACVEVLGENLTDPD
jgi:hypothetical protein